MHKRNYKHIHKGFSLIEIMVVVAIVGLLVTISTISYTKVRQNSNNKNREATAKIVANAIENYSRISEEPLRCSQLAAAPAVAAKLLELKPEIIADPDNPSLTRISCAAPGKTKPAGSDSFFVSNLGCPIVKIEYKKDGSSNFGLVEVPGPTKEGSPCPPSPNPDTL